MPSSKQTQAMNTALQSTVEPSQFAQFGKLPMELRLMCWRAAIPGPHIITISHEKDKKAMLPKEHSIASYSIPNIFGVIRRAAKSLKLHSLDSTPTV